MNKLEQHLRNIEDILGSNEIPPASEPDKLGWHLSKIEDLLSNGGGSGGTSNYEDLSNKPAINSTTLSGNKSLSDLGIQAVIDSNNKLDYSLLSNTPTIPTEVTETTVSGWGFTKNAGTLTGITMNGSTVTVNNGVAQLGTVITDISSKANDSEVVKLAGAQTITGDKTINAQVLLSNGGANTYNVKQDQWGELIIFNSSNTGRYLVDIYDNGVLLDGETVAPRSTNNTDLGQSGRKWKNIWASVSVDTPKVSFTGDMEISATVGLNLKAAGGVWLWNDILPVYSPSIGNENYKLGDLWLGGTIKDGTNTISPADLAALITYAKGQGWIQ